MYISNVKDVVLLNKALNSIKLAVGYIEGLECVTYRSSMFGRVLVLRDIVRNLEGEISAIE